MKRREFLQYGVRAALAAGACGFASCLLPGSAFSREDMSELRGLTIADAHAHPYQLFGVNRRDATTPTVDMMKKVGMAVCSFSAVGDLTLYPNRFGLPFADTVGQLRMVKGLEDEGKVKRVLSAADLKSVTAPGNATGAVMAVEGADALEGRMENLDRLYDYGVRMITLMHDHNNAIGFNQRSQNDGPLTPFGVKVVERMNERGILIDVAHAKTGTLASIVEASRAPVVDSHTSPLPYGYETKNSQRLRTWPEMETIAKHGGLVCTWPYAVSRGTLQRTTLKDWAAEILLMKNRLGIEHCGLGTDGGGSLPNVVAGWDSILSLPKLVAAMREAGLTQSDIAAYVGGNFLRVLGGCLG